MDFGPKTLQEAVAFFEDPENCTAFMVARRWPAGVSCPTCGREDVTYIPQRRVWQCKTRHAKCQFSVKVGTVFEDSPIALKSWLMAMWMIANCRIPDLRMRHTHGSVVLNVAEKSTVYTDGWHGYQNLKYAGYIHETVNHVDQYVRGQVHTQGIENFWSLLKRTLNGTYVAVSPFHLDRYVVEQVFRFNNRINRKDGDRFSKVVSQVVGKRLTYVQLTGKEKPKPF